MLSQKIPINAERDPKTGLIPCTACTQCCQYVAIEVDTPETRRDFDNIRWYLYHPGIEVYVDHEDTWNVLLYSRCENLLADGKCAVYETRPYICRNFDNETCEPNTNEPAEKVIFRTADDLEQWMRLTRTHDRLAMKEAALERRRLRRAGKAGAKAKEKAKDRERAQAARRAAKAVARTHAGIKAGGGKAGRNGSRKATSDSRAKSGKRSR